MPLKYICSTGADWNGMLCRQDTKLIHVVYIVSVLYSAAFCAGCWIFQTNNTTKRNDAAILTHSSRSMFALSPVVALPQWSISLRAGGAALKKRPVGEEQQQAASNRQAASSEKRRKPWTSSTPPSFSGAIVGFWVSQRRMINHEDSEEEK